MALAFPVEEKEKLTGGLRGRIAQDYLKGLNIDPENTQWAVVRHQDKTHPHMHPVVNWVDLEGQTVSDQFIRSRSVDVCKGIEQAYGLIVADQVGRQQAREIGPTPKQQQATTPKEEHSADWSRARQELGRALSYTAGQARSFDELREALRPRGFELEMTRRKDGSSAGVVFAQDGHRVKGIQVGREYSAGNLEAGFAKARELGQDPAQQWQQGGSGLRAGQAGGRVRPGQAAAGPAAAQPAAVPGLWDRRLIFSATRYARATARH